MSTSVVASVVVAGYEFTEVPVLNAGDWFGKTYMIHIDYGAYVVRLVVEADSASNAIDVLADNEEWSTSIVVADFEMSDYDEETCPRAGNTGKMVDLDNIYLHTCEAKYFASFLDNGVKPTEFEWPDND